LIALSKLDGSTMHINEEHVERVEGGVNSVIYLTNGTYQVVRDNVGDIIEEIRAEKQALLTRAIAGAPSGCPVASVSTMPSGGGNAGGGPA